MVAEGGLLTRSPCLQTGPEPGVLGRGQCTIESHLVGSPLIASETAHVRAGMLVPLRVEIYAAETCARLSYDRPSSSLARWWRRHQREPRMMGRREAGQGQFFYSLDLDEVVPLSDTREQPIMVLFSNKDYSPIKDSESLIGNPCDATKS